MSLKSCEKAETNVYALEITLEGDAFKDAVSKAYLKNKGKYNTPGFRKGKAPKHVIENYYGKEVFWYDAVDMQFSDLYDAAVKEAGISPVADPADVDVSEISENGFTLTMKVTVKPEVKIKKYKGLTAEKEKVSVKKAEVKEAVDSELEKNSTVVSVEDRAAKKGDIANIDFEGFLGETAFEGGKGEKYDLELGSGSFIPGFEEQVIGHKTGDEFDVKVTFPSDYGAEELAGKEAVFKVVLHKISVKQLPAYDDEFVKDVSSFDTVADYEKSVEEDLKTKKEAEANRAFENAILDSLVENTSCEIPSVMIDKETENQLNEFNYRLQMQGMSLDMYLQYTGMDINALKDSYKENAEKQVKLRLALEEIAKKEKLEASEEDIETEIKTYADSYNMKVDEVKKYIAADDVKADLVCRKAMDLVKENAVASAKKKAPAKDAESGEEKPVKAAKAPAKTAKPKAEKAAKADDTEKAEKAPAKKPAAKKPAAKKKADAE